MTVTVTAGDRSTRRDNSIRILGDLVGFNTVSDRSNLDLVDYVESCLHAHGAHTWRLPSEDGLKANLVARLGPDVDGGLILSGHSDVVPVDGQAWSTSPFELTRVDDRLFGRGSADMKGFVACVLACLPEIAARDLRKPIYLALSYDEELGCLGVHDIISDLNRRAIRPDLCIVGEPTMMDVGLAHKGNRTFRLTFTGQAAHSSRAPTAVNAVAYAAELVTSVTAAQAEIARRGPFMQGFDIEYTTVHVGVMTGGRQVNIVPDRCVVDMEFRFLPGVDPAALTENLVMAEVRRLDRAMAKRKPGCGVAVEPAYAYPAFNMATDHPAVTIVKRCAGRNSDVKLSYGTEAGCFREAMEMPVIVCGPGDIRQAHQPDEFIAVDQLDACGDFLIDLVTVIC
ncbi:acetylornithine deacetylase [Rhizobium sp. 9140]|uniref:acetylornithine deacetylase n=1 Tax=Rhizobium sp. 9140 TaxID=1761900 RepID=UPI000795FBB9|nr:acetylornithine deacetylase [Rhizobium sp. 9140]CZT38082.1 acetylornithine deacetylase [Rhizobium sp. 9140]